MGVLAFFSVNQVVHVPKGKTGGIMKDCIKTLFGALILGLILVLPAYSADTINVLLATLIGQ